MRLPRDLRRLARRFASRLPPDLQTHLRTLGRMGSHHPRVGVPPADAAVLVLAAHPDDESIGCGGTIAHLTSRGNAVTVLIATDGDALLVSDPGGNLAARRRAEAEEACRALGAPPPRFLGLPDRDLGKARAEAAAGISALVAEGRPDVVMLPWFGDRNDDHRALNDALAEAAIPPDVEVWAYEIWAPLVANRLVDITAVAEPKRAALDAHSSDTLLDLHAVFGLNRYRAETGRLNGEFAEAFLQAPVETYVELVRESASP